MESGARPSHYLLTVPAAPGYSMVLPNNLGRDGNGVDVFALREQRGALRRSGGRFRIWGAQTNFGYGTPAYGSANREELNKVGHCKRPFSSHLRALGWIQSCVTLSGSGARIYPTPEPILEPTSARS